MGLWETIRFGVGPVAQYFDNLPEYAHFSFTLQTTVTFPSLIQSNNISGAQFTWIAKFQICGKKKISTILFLPGCKTENQIFSP